LKKKQEKERADEVKRIHEKEDKQRKKEELERLEREREEKEQSLKKNQEKYATTMKPNETIDLTKHDENEEKVVVLIINENADKEETLASPVSNNKVETQKDGIGQDTHPDKDDISHLDKDDTSHQDKYDISSTNSE
jgi:hypothetical protein